MVSWIRICRCRGHGFDPWLRKIPHATEPLSPRTTIAELACPRACALQRERHPPCEAYSPQQRAAPARRNESRHIAVKTQSSQENQRENHNDRFYNLWFIEHFLCVRHCPEAINLYKKYLGSHLVPLWQKEMSLGLGNLPSTCQRVTSEARTWSGVCLFCTLFSKKT